MKSKGPIMIDGVEVPTPSTYTFDIEDLSSENTGRTLDGVMHKDVVAVKDYYTCEWKGLSWQEAADLLNLVDGKTSVRVTLIDPRMPNKTMTKYFYVGKRSGALKTLRHTTNMWTVTFQFIGI